MKKSVSPVVAVALLLVMTVVAAAGFQTWYNTYSSSILGDVEDSGFNNRILVQSLIGDNLYLRSDAAQYLQTFKILDSNGTEMCSFEDGSDTLGSNKTILLFDFDNGGYNSSHVFDRSYTQNNGTLTNDATILTTGCTYGNCLYLDGVDDYVNVPHNANQLLTSGFTISAWIKPDSEGEGGTAATAAGRIVDKSAGVASTDGFSFYLDGNGGERLRARIDGGTVGTGDTGSVIYGDGNWYHVAVTITYDGNATFYVNGVGGDSDNVGSLDAITTTNSLRVGTRSLGTTDRDFNGTIDELVIYSDVLTSAEISALYSIKQAKFYEQIIQDGIKNMNVSVCNLIRGERYEIVAISNKYTMQESVVKR